MENALGHRLVALLGDPLDHSLAHPLALGFALGLAVQFSQELSAFQSAFLSEQMFSWKELVDPLTPGLDFVLVYVLEYNCETCVSVWGGGGGHS